MRSEYPFNTGWKFHPGDVPDGQADGLNDGAWREVNLPHDWSIEGPFSERWASATGYLPGGIGWYRKEFDAPSSWSGQRVAIEFDGVYRNSTVWINGHLLGHRPNGFVSFRYDLTPYLRIGDRNTLAVRVDHSCFADSRWYTGSGIYRNVRLVVTPPISIRPWGVFATTPTVNPESAEVLVEVSLENDTALSADVCVQASLHGEDGVVATVAQAVSFTTKAKGAVGLRMQVPAPRLWSPEHPHLYTLKTAIVCEGTTLDSQDTRIGIRSICFDAYEGFTLNGESVKMKGVCLHDDAGALGVAVPPRVWERRLRTLKGAGVNAIRMAHNPHMTQLYDLCDEIGFLVQDEAFDEWELGKNKWVAGWNVGTPGTDGYHEHFAEWAEADLRDMVLRDRNHPCIVMWSIGNEIDYPNDPYTHEILDHGTNPQIYGRGFRAENPHSNRLGEIARTLVAIVKSYDTTRPVTAGLASALISNETGYADALDLAGYNYQEGRYAEDHARFPNRVIYGSENGMHFEFWETVASLPYISGQFLWTGIDYLGEAGKWPERSNTAGLLDLAGYPKPEYYFRQSIWTDAPMVYLGTREPTEGQEATNLWSHKEAEPAWRGADGELLKVVCFTNCERVELFLNGRSIGVKALADAEGHVMLWDVPYEPGTLRAVALRDGTQVAECELSSYGPPARITAIADVDRLAADAEDLVHIEIAIVDATGIPVPDASNEIHWTVEGPARLLGIESGDSASHEPCQAEKRRAFRGRLLGYVQATGQSGDIVVTLSSPGLVGATLKLEAAQ